MSLALRKLIMIKRNIEEKEIKRNDLKFVSDTKLKFCINDILKKLYIT